ncbi:MAG: gfo/Idh/MocA family oxidoreductase [Planctomycetota bacterium]|nr:MAG: gfo/Idh/MocA family oxidoreductase [Planctomycetota bacterium]
MEIAMSHRKANRRDFLKSTAAGAAVAGTVSLAKASHAAGSDELKIALIGCGGRGTGAAINALNNAAGVRLKLVAMADAFDSRLEASLKAISSRFPEQVDVPPERRFVGLGAYKDVMATDADIVLLCTPPGFRPQQFEAAVAAGKHIFTEKPLAVDGPGIRRIQKANEQAKAKGVIVAVGHHLRHEVKHIEVMKRVHDGAIGKLKFLRAYFNSAGVWVRPRREGQTEMEYQVMNWYYFTWLSGDHIVEQHVHDLDVCNWFMQDQHPIEAQGMGGRQFRIGPDYGEIFDHHAVEFTYPDGTKAYSYCRHTPNCWNSFSEHAHGTNGYVSVQGHGQAELVVDGREPQKWDRGPDGHQLEWDHMLAALRDGEKYNEVDTRLPATVMAIMGRMATYSGKIVTWGDVVQSELDLSPSGYTWDSEPQPKPGPDGIYPCAVPGITKAW